MKTLKLLALAAFALLFSQCKTPTQATGTQPSLLEVTKILQAAENKFTEYTKQTGTGYKQGIMLTSQWLGSQPTVATATPLDSTYIYITLKSGLVTTFSVDIVNDSGYSIFRGGGSPVSGGRLIDAANAAKNEIINKQILIYAAAYSEFYKPGEMDALIALLNSSTLGLTVKLLKDAQCTYDILPQLGNYGVVIFDTHGMPDAVKIGGEVDTAVNDDEALLKQNVNKVAGAKAYDLVLSGDLRLSKSNRWNVKNELVPYYIIFATTKYLGSLPQMPSTILFGNMCYSGQLNPGKYTGTPMRTAMLGKNPISYYCFATDNGSSHPVSDDFAKQMEKSLMRRLAIDYDSTGLAHLQADGTEFFDNDIFQLSQRRIILNCKHFAADNYSYKNCTDVFTDNRDGIIYKAVCIGKQTWMAENLRYNAPGSRCYDDNQPICDKYGRLYDWSTVMQGAPSDSSAKGKVQGVCPKGWHVPTLFEWRDLAVAVGGILSGTKYLNAGGALKSTTPDWIQPNYGATNSSGFTALPAGEYNENGAGGFSNLGRYAFFWSSTALRTANEFAFELLGANATAFISNVSNPYFSCRCLKD